MVKTEGSAASVLAVDETLLAHADHWLVREIVHFIKRTLKRMDLTSRSFFALDRAGQLLCGHAVRAGAGVRTGRTCSTIPSGRTTIALSGDECRAADDEQRPDAAADAVPRRAGAGRRSCSATETRSTRARRCEAGLVSFAPDELDWDDEVRLAIESRAAFSPDALTGMEANLRFAGPETMETKIFGRLTAWQNWIFQRPNAVGEKGALTAYGSQARPEFDFKRT